MILLFSNGMQYEEVTLGVVELSRYSSIAPLTMRWRLIGRAVRCGATQSTVHTAYQISIP